MVNILYRESATATKPTSTSVKGAPLTILELDGNFRSVKDQVEAIINGSTTLTSTPLSGTPTAPTAAVNTNSTQIATTAYVVAQIADDAPTKTGTGASGTWNISISGNAATATTATTATTASAVTNGVVTTGSYADPSWITSLSETKVLPTQTGNSGKALVTNGTSTSWQTTGATLTDDTTTNTTQYLGMARSTTGAWTAAYVASTKLYYNPSNGKLSSTTFNSLSDRNQKTNITPVTNAISTINSIGGYEFDWKDSGEKSAGVIAQELEEVLPHLVTTNDDGIKSVNYAGLTAYLIESIKELNAKIKVLESK